MANLSESDIVNISKLTRIELQKPEQKQMVGEISSILSFVDALQKIDTNGMEATSQVTGLTDVWREDKVKTCTIERDVLLSQAPDTLDGYIKVKKVL